MKFLTLCPGGGAFDSLYCPKGRVSVQNDCPGGGFLLPSSRVPGGWLWIKLIPALRKNFCSSQCSNDSCCKREPSSSKDINIYPNNMFAELFAFVSMSCLTKLSRGEPSEQVVLTGILGNAEAIISLTVSYKLA